MGAIHIRDRLREGLAYMCSRMERESEQSRALDRLRFDALDAIDIKEVVLVVIRNEAFHLLRTHAAVRLSYVDDRNVQIGKNIDARTHQREYGTERHSNNHHDHADGPPKSSTDEPHVQCPPSAC